MVELYNAGKSRSEIVKEYELTASALDRWIRQYNSASSLPAKDRTSVEDPAYQELLKENRRLRRENDILKAAALILGRTDG